MSDPCFSRSYGCNHSGQGAASHERLDPQRVAVLRRRCMPNVLLSTYSSVRFFRPLKVEVKLGSRSL